MWLFHPSLSECRLEAEVSRRLRNRVLEVVSAQEKKMCESPRGAGYWWIWERNDTVLLSHILLAEGGSNIILL